MSADQSADSIPQADSIRLFLCGDVMTGRGIDQVLPHPSDPRLHELGLALPVESTIDQRAILDLVKINADLGRFGGLIKMWLTTNADFESAQGLQRKLENTLTDVRL